MNITIPSPKSAFAKVGYGRQWIESAILGLIGWAVRIIAQLTWAALVVTAAAIMSAILGRMLGFPVPYVRVTPQDLMPIGVFLFCVAFMLKNRS